MSNQLISNLAPTYGCKLQHSSVYMIDNCLKNGQHHFQKIWSHWVTPEPLHIFNAKIPFRFFALKLNLNCYLILGTTLSKCIITANSYALVPIVQNCQYLVLTAFRLFISFYKRSPTAKLTFS